MKTKKQKLIDILSSDIVTVKRSIAENVKKLTENYCYNFAWVGEQLYEDNFNLTKYTNLLLSLESVDEEVAINYEIESNMYYISRPHNVRENSTGSLHREASTYKFICTMKYIDYLKLIKRNIAK